MDFSSVPFVLVFLPIFFCLYLLARPSFRFALVLIASVFFLVAGQWIALPWLVGLGLVNYGIGRVIASRLESKKKVTAWLWSGIGLNLGFLLAFKLLVTYQIKPTVLGGLPINTAVLPLGLSYFTFQVIAYLVDVAQENIPVEKNLLRFLSYILFFPKLAAGPITQYQDFASQVGSLNPSEKDVLSGLGRVIAGEIKRLFIANPLGVFAAAAFTRAHPNYEPYLAWLALLASLMQIYFDFSAYTDIAIGLGKMIGVRLPENFNYPFISQSLSEYWRRWHMTLIGWLREYVFYPLERHRLNFFGQQVNLLVIFLLTGLWHGPTLNYIVWGLLQGLAIVFESTPAGKWWLGKAWRPLRHLVTLLVILFSWAFFRSASLPYAFEFLRRLAGDRSGLDLPSGNSHPPVFGPVQLIALLVALVFSLPVKNLIQAWLGKLGQLGRVGPLRGCFAKTLPYFTEALKRGAAFFWERKRWWLVPMVVVMVSFGVIVLLSESAAPARFIYAGF
jgi:alginate O-acetyltransferase complex protein AlgI